MDPPDPPWGKAFLLEQQLCPEALTSGACLRLFLDAVKVRPGLGMGCSHPPVFSAFLWHFSRCS